MEAEEDGWSFPLLFGPIVKIISPLEQMVYSYPAPERVIRKLRHGERIRPADVARMRPLRSYFEDVADDAIFQHVMAIARGARYLSDREIDGTVLSAISGVAEARTSALLAQNLLCSLPVITNVSAEKLLKVRRRERESFILCRNAIQNALAEVARAKPTAQAMRELYADIIEPELARLQLRVRQLRNGPLLRAFQEAAIVTGVMAAGVRCRGHPHSKGAREGSSGAL